MHILPLLIFVSNIPTADWLKICFHGPAQVTCHQTSSKQGLDGRGMDAWEINLYCPLTELLPAVCVDDLLNTNVR